MLFIFQQVKKFMQPEFSPTCVREWIVEEKSSNLLNLFPYDTLHYCPFFPRLVLPSGLLP